MVAVGEFFSFRPDWHQDDRVRPLVRQYQLTLDAVLRDHPGLASCAVFCRHCGIRFLTHPRNANRRDLCCEFGCRGHHHRRQANERSKKHYRTDRGRRNKKRLNGKRSAACGGGNGMSPDSAPADMVSADADTSSSDTSSAVEPASQSASHPMHQPSPVAFEEVPREDVRLMLDGFWLDEATLVRSPVLSYLAIIASIVEGRAISRKELLHTLRQSLRQRSFDRLPRREYVLRFHDQHPP